MEGDGSQMMPGRTQRGGWVKAKKLSQCRRCSGEIPDGRRTFCSDECVHQWKLRTDPGYLRDHVFERDKGVCALCGTDTVALRLHFLKLDYKARYRFLKEWKLREGFRKSLWDADHVVPVAEGGGECDLTNMRTLCLKCHRQATAELRERLTSKRSRD
jgi:5-methylcytosine-specific restriction endonuclease McrA